MVEQWNCGKFAGAWLTSNARKGASRKARRARVRGAHPSKTPPTHSIWDQLLAGHAVAFLRCGMLPHQILIKPRDCAPDCVNLVLALHEPVTLVRIVVDVHDPAFLLQDI